MCADSIYNNYKLSKYNFVVELPSEEKKIRVMNLLSRAIVEFDCSNHGLATYIEKKIR